MEENEGFSTKEKNSINFTVDSSLIKPIPIEERNEELNDLELEVYDQKKFEEGVLEQIDDAIQRVEEKQIKKEIQQTYNQIQ